MKRGLPVLALSSGHIGSQAVAMPRALAPFPAVSEKEALLGLPCPPFTLTLSLGHRPYYILSVSPLAIRSRFSLYRGCHGLSPGGQEAERRRCGVPRGALSLTTVTGTCFLFSVPGGSESFSEAGCQHSAEVQREVT